MSAAAFDGNSFRAIKQINKIKTTTPWCVVSTRFSLQISAEIWKSSPKRQTIVCPVGAKSKNKIRIHAKRSAFLPEAVEK